MMLSLLYLAGSLLVWAGSLDQIVRLISRESSEDISIVYVVCLLIANIAMLPKALDSRIWVWWFCRVTSTVLLAVLAALVIYYQ